jgi:hypothetical protein
VPARRAPSSPASPPVPASGPPGAAEATRRGRSSDIAITSLGRAGLPHLHHQQERRLPGCEVHAITSVYAVRMTRPAQSWCLAGHWRNLRVTRDPQVTPASSLYQGGNITLDGVKPPGGGLAQAPPGVRLRPRSGTNGRHCRSGGNQWEESMRKLLVACAATGSLLLGTAGVAAGQGVAEAATIAHESWRGWRTTKAASASAIAAAVKAHPSCPLSRKCGWIRAACTPALPAHTAVRQYRSPVSIHACPRGAWARARVSWLMHVGVVAAQGSYEESSGSPARADQRFDRPGSPGASPRQVPSSGSYSSRSNTSMSSPSRMSEYGLGPVPRT